MRIFKNKPPVETEEQPPSETDSFRSAVLTSGMPPEVAETTLKEIDRIAKMPVGSAEHTIGINYLEYLTNLPWNQSSEDRLDLAAARRILDERHDGLAEIKTRVMEHLAVRILQSERRHAILVVDDEKLTRNNLRHVLGARRIPGDDGRQWDGSHAKNP